jgi:predicted transcriptional regulator
MTVISGDARRVLGFGNRESLDIIDLILLVCLNGTMKTHVMYKCNLNSKQVQDYIELLIKFELLERSDVLKGRNTYKTTDRGKRFIKAYAELFEIFDLVRDGSHQPLDPSGDGDLKEGGSRIG